MKYKCEIVINLPITDVVELWSNETYFKHWQDGFQSIEIIEGEAGEIGAKSKILLQQGKRKMVLMETIISNKLPVEKKALYEHSHMTNTQTTKFKELDHNSTLYVSEVEYTKFNGIVPKMMALFFAGMFKKQSEKWMKQFKDFAEEHS